MHFIVSWEIKATGDEFTRINDELRDKLKLHSWVRPLTSLYVVNVASQEIWNSILKELQSVGEKYPNKINLLLSPLMQGGRYNGLMGSKMWDEINQRSV